MKNNRLKLIKNNGGSVRVTRARNRLIRLYNANRKNGGWREVQRLCGAKNVAIVYNFAVHGDEPPNLEDRKACFLPARKCPTCKQSLPNGKEHQHKEIPSWMKSWRQLSKDKRDGAIRSFIEKVTGS